MFSGPPGWQTTVGLTPIDDSIDLRRPSSFHHDLLDFFVAIVGCCCSMSHIWWPRCGHIGICTGLLPSAPSGDNDTFPFIFPSLQRLALSSSSTSITSNLSSTSRKCDSASSPRLRPISLALGPTSTEPRPVWPPRPQISPNFWRWQCVSSPLLSHGIVTVLELLAISGLWGRWRYIHLLWSNRTYQRNNT